MKKETKDRVLTVISAALVVATFVAMIVCGVAAAVSGCQMYAAFSQEPEPHTPTVRLWTYDEVSTYAEPEVETLHEPVINNSASASESDEILLKIAMAEAEGEDTVSKALVMRVVLNRVADTRFPDNVHDVVFAKNQFTPVQAGGRYWTTTPNEGCYRALELVKSGWDESRGALFFESCEGESWHSNNLTFLFRHGKLNFYE